MDQAQTDEQLIAQWEQPKRVNSLTGKGTGKLWIIALPAALLLIALAYWQKELNFGLAGLVLLVAVFAIQSQSKANSLPVAVTTTRIVIGKRQTLLSDCAGFWVDDQGDVVEINIETKKPGLLPMTFLYSTPSGDEARATMAQILPELEPREKKLGDKLGNYFRL